MREKGFNYISYDPYGAEKVGEYDPQKINFISLFEVFEHHPFPRVLINEITSCSTNQKLVILMSTSRIPRKYASDPLAWNYIAPRNGHVSFASKECMRLLSKSVGMFYFVVGNNMHIMFRPAGWQRAILLSASLLLEKLSRRLGSFLQIKVSH